jgi:mannosyltransferase
MNFLNNRLLDRYIYIKNVSNSTLNIFYNFAHCLLYPSSYEGFGIPVIEAMKVGCPVIAMKSSSIPEISANAALLLDSLSVEKAKLFVAQLEDSAFRKNIVEKGIENSHRFSWDKCYSEVKTLYKKLSA